MARKKNNSYTTKNKKLKGINTKVIISRIYNKPKINTPISARTFIRSILDNGERPFIMRSGRKIVKMKTHELAQDGKTIETQAIILLKQLYKNPINRPKGLISKYIYNNKTNTEKKEFTDIINNNNKNKKKHEHKNKKIKVLQDFFLAQKTTMFLNNNNISSILPCEVEIGTNILMKNTNHKTSNDDSEDDIVYKPPIVISTYCELDKSSKNTTASNSKGKDVTDKSHKSTPDEKSEDKESEDDTNIDVSSGESNTDKSNTDSGDEEDNSDVLNAITNNTITPNSFFTHRASIINNVPTTFKNNDDSDISNDTDIDDLKESTDSEDYIIISDDENSKDSNVDSDNNDKDKKKKRKRKKVKKDNEFVDDSNIIEDESIQTEILQSTPYIANNTGTKVIYIDKSILSEYNLNIHHSSNIVVANEPIPTYLLDFYAMPGYLRVPLLFNNGSNFTDKPNRYFYIPLDIKHVNKLESRERTRYVKQHIVAHLIAELFPDYTIANMSNVHNLRIPNLPIIKGRSDLILKNKHPETISKTKPYFMVIELKICNAMVDDYLRDFIKANLVYGYELVDHANVDTTDKPYYQPKLFECKELNTVNVDYSHTNKNTIYPVREPKTGKIKNTNLLQSNMYTAHMLQLIFYVICIIYNDFLKFKKQYKNNIYTAPYFVSGALVVIPGFCAPINHNKKSIKNKDNVIAVVCGVNNMLLQNIMKIFFSRYEKYDNIIYKNTCFNRIECILPNNKLSYIRLHVSNIIMIPKGVVLTILPDNKAVCFVVIHGSGIMSEHTVFTYLCNKLPWINFRWIR